MKARHLVLLGTAAGLGVIVAMLWWQSAGNSNKVATTTSPGELGPSAPVAEKPEANATRRGMLPRGGGKTPRSAIAGAVRADRPSLPSRRTKPMTASQIRRPPPELDTSELRRGPGERLSDQAIPDNLASHVDLAYQLYESRDYERARDVGLKVLGALDKNVSLRRLVIASSCHLGDRDAAAEHISTLGSFDTEAMESTCAEIENRSGPN